MSRFSAGNPIEETAEIGEIQTRPDEADYEPVSSTLWRQREEYCARIIQNAWRKYGGHNAAVVGESTSQHDVNEVPTDISGKDVTARSSKTEAEIEDIVRRSKSPSNTSKVASPTEARETSPL